MPSRHLVSSPLLPALLLLSSCAAPTSPQPASPAAAPPVHVETESDTQQPQVPAPAPITALEDFSYASSEQFVGRLDARGVVFLDIHDDDSEEQRPIRAVRLCGAELDAQSITWAQDLSGRFGSETLREFPDNMRCEAETCWHEAFEAGDHRGLYRFEQGVLREVAWTSGPPAHIMDTYLAMEDRFVDEAFEALRAQPCGAVHEGALREP